MKKMEMGVVREIRIIGWMGIIGIIGLRRDIGSRLSYHKLGGIMSLSL